MNLSGILVIVTPEWVETVVTELNAMEGVEVHQTDPVTGRIIVVQEATDIHAEIEGVKRIKAMPHVVMADMVYHYFADDARAYDAMPAELTEDTQVCVPDYLNT
jgi:periplasmic nitrate reductase NapD